MSSRKPSPSHTERARATFKRLTDAGYIHLGGYVSRETIDMLDRVKKQAKLTGRAAAIELIVTRIEHHPQLKKELGL